MIYIGDIILNLNKEIYEFYEWNDNDDIEYLKQIPALRVSTKTLQDFTNSEIIINDPILKLLKNNCDFYENSSENYEILFLMTDLKKAIAINIKDNKIHKRSALLLADEEDIINNCLDLKITNINYKIIKKNEEKEYLTRKEKKIKNDLIKEIKNLYKNNEIEKLNYYYFEYFNKVSNDKELVYKCLLDSFNNFNNNHLKLYDISSLSYKIK